MSSSACGVSQRRRMIAKKAPTFARMSLRVTPEKAGRLSEMGPERGMLSYLIIGAVAAELGEAECVARENSHTGVRTWRIRICGSDRRAVRVRRECPPLRR